MLKRLLSNRSQTARDTTVRADSRSGAPAVRRPAPLPRMRWYS